MEILHDGVVTFDFGLLNPGRKLSSTLAFPVSISYLIEPLYYGRQCQNVCSLVFMPKTVMYFSTPPQNHCQLHLVSLTIPLFLR